MIVGLHHSRGSEYFHEVIKMARKSGLLLWGIFVFCNLALAQGRVAIVGGTVVNVRDGTLIPGAVVVIEGDRIASVSPGGQVPAGATIVDARGKYVLPSLIDAHVHYMDWVSELFLAHGVTTAIETGGSEWTLVQRDGIAKGKIPGPRLFSGGGSIRGPINPADPYFHLEDPYYFEGNKQPQVASVNSVQEARQAAEEQVAMGVDLIKLYDGLTPDMLKAIIEIAHKAKIPAIGHTRNAWEAVELGYDEIVHTTGIARALVKDQADLRKVDNAADLHAYMDPSESDKLIAAMVKKGVHLNPTLRTEWGWAWKDKFQHEDFDLLFNNLALRYIPLNVRLGIVNEYNQVSIYWARTYKRFADYSSAEKELKRKAVNNALQFVKKFVDAGGKLCSGTDTLSTYGLSLHQELQILVEEVGLSPKQAILSVTQCPAEFLGWENKLGSVEAGKLADLIIVGGNPLQDIRNLRKVEMVFKEGKRMDISYHPGFVNPIPQPSPFSTSHLFPVPYIRSISPRVATEGDMEVELTLQGTGLIQQSLVRFKGESVPTEFVNLYQLKAKVPGRLLERAGTFPVEVVNPVPNGIFAVGAEEFRGIGLIEGDKSNRLYLMVKFR